MKNETSVSFLKSKPFVDQKPLKGYLANSEDPDEMLHNAAFHLDLHCLLRQNLSSEKLFVMFVCFCCFMSQSTAMVMGGQPVGLTTLFLGKLEQAVNQ